MSKTYMLELTEAEAAALSRFIGDELLSQEELLDLVKVEVKLADLGFPPVTDEEDQANAETDRQIRREEGV